MADGQNEILLRLKSISKSFSGVKVLDDISLDIVKGEVHCILGENGAGKSTLIKILSGAYHKDSGSIEIDGAEVQIENSRDARNLGIGTVYQEMSLAPTLNAVENIFLGCEECLAGGLVLDRPAMRKRTLDILERLDAQLDVDIQVRYLSIAKMQIIEIARSLIFDNKIIIMDEPTSSLSKRDIGELFKIIEKLKRDGVTVIYISHKLEELGQIGDRVTVLRDGKLIDTVKLAETSMKAIIVMMVGRDFDVNLRAVPRDHSGEVVLEARNISTADGKVHDASFSLRKGTILGFAGLVGAGRTELMKVVFGAARPVAGSVFLKGVEMRNMTTAKAVRRSIAYLSEDRKKEGLVLGMPISSNITLANLSRIAKGFVLNLAAERRDAEAMRERLRIATDTVRKLARFLSGGNQQKVVIAKWLYSNCEILIFDEPTRGIDVGARAEIYGLMNRLADEGRSIILVSSDLNEILHMSNRIVVMHEGQVTGEVENAPGTRQEDIMSLMLGGV